MVTSISAFVLKTSIPLFTVISADGAKAAISVFFCSLWVSFLHPAMAIVTISNAKRVCFNCIHLLSNFALVTGGRGVVAINFLGYIAAISPMPVIQGGETFFIIPIISGYYLLFDFLM